MGRKKGSSAGAQVAARERAKWFVRIDDKATGPYDVETMVSWWRAGEIDSETLVRRGRYAAGNDFQQIATLFPRSVPPEVPTVDEAKLEDGDELRAATPFSAAEIEMLEARGAFGFANLPKPASTGAVHGFGLYDDALELSTSEREAVVVRMGRDEGDTDLLLIADELGEPAPEHAPSADAVDALIAEAEEALGGEAAADDASIATSAGQLQLVDESVDDAASMASMASFFSQTSSTAGGAETALVERHLFAQRRGVTPLLLTPQHRLNTTFVTQADLTRMRAELGSGANSRELEYEQMRIRYRREISDVCAREEESNFKIEDLGLLERMLLQQEGHRLTRTAPQTAALARPPVPTPASGHEKRRRHGQAGPKTTREAAWAAEAAAEAAAMALEPGTSRLEGVYEGVTRVEAGYIGVVRLLPHDSNGMGGVVHDNYGRARGFHGQRPSEAQASSELEPVRVALLAPPRSQLPVNVKRKFDSRSSGHPEHQLWWRHISEFVGWHVILNGVARPCSLDDERRWFSRVEGLAIGAGGGPFAPAQPENDDGGLDPPSMSQLPPPPSKPGERYAAQFEMHSIRIVATDEFWPGKELASVETLWDSEDGALLKDLTDQTETGLNPKIEIPNVPVHGDAESIGDWG